MTTYSPYLKDPSGVSIIYLKTDNNGPYGTYSRVYGISSDTYNHSIAAAGKILNRDSRIGIDLLTDVIGTPIIGYGDNMELYNKEGTVLQSISQQPMQPMQPS